MKARKLTDTDSDSLLSGAQGGWQIVGKWIWRSKQKIATISAKVKGIGKGKSKY